MHEAHTPPRFRRATLCLDVPPVPLLLVEPRLANRRNVLYVPTALNRDGPVRGTSIKRTRGNILFGNFWQMASGGRGTSSAEQIFGLTSLWPQRPLQQKTMFAYWAASPAQGAALGYCGIWHVQAHAFSASTCSHSRRRHGYVRGAI